jgi:hypothetical protein
MAWLCRLPFRWEIVPFDFYSMLDLVIDSVESRHRELHPTGVLEEIVCELYIVEEGPSVHDDRPGDAATHLGGVRQPTLATERVA